MLDWIRGLFSRPSRAARRSVRPRVRPRLEALEDRIAPDGDPTKPLIVTNTSSDANVVGSLPYEVNHVQTGQNIVFDPNLDNQTITLTSPIDLGQNGATNVSILGQDATTGQSLNITISGGGGTRLFEVLPYINDTINNLTLTNGTAWFSNNPQGAAVLVDENG